MIAEGVNRRVLYENFEFFLNFSDSRIRLGGFFWYSGVYSLIQNDANFAKP